MQGQELKALRKGMALSQDGLATALGMSKKFVGMMERGDAPIEDRTAFAVRWLVEHPEDRPDIDWDLMTAMTGAEVMERLLADDARPWDGREWGPWRLSVDSMTLDFHSHMTLVDRIDGEDVYERRERYYVPLEEMVAPRDVINWIGQIARKSWGAPALGHFVSALNDIFHLQARFMQRDGFEGREVLLAWLEGRFAPARVSA